METGENIFFEKLRKKIVEKMKQSYPGIPDDITTWKGQNIIDFQTELQFKINQNISEKWFYTHMKSDETKLPRIDILNFLSQYVGAQNWNDFKFNAENKETSGIQAKANQKLYVWPFIVLAIIMSVYLLYSRYRTQEYFFVFYDNDTKQAIRNCLIEVNVLSDNESPTSYLCDENGSFSLKTNQRNVRFVVETPYYHNDTIYRTLNSFSKTERIKLKLDDYAVMIQYFSKSNVEDWLKRRNDLSKVFADDAKIFQVINETVGMEIYNKNEFINKLTIPSGSLKDIEVIDTQYTDGKITYLRFRQNPDSK